MIGKRLSVRQLTCLCGPQSQLGFVLHVAVVSHTKESMLRIAIACVLTHLRWSSGLASAARLDELAEPVRCGQ